jgi:hypothetical protein
MSVAHTLASPSSVPEEAIKTSAAPPLSDALHEFATSTRPVSEAAIVDLCALVARLASLCGSDSDAWKLFVLTITRRRFHTRAPTAKEEAASAAAAAAEDCVEGEGERLIYYIATCCLHRIAASSSGSVEAGKAVAALINLALPAGGTRDLCALAEHIGTDVLTDSGYVAQRTSEGHNAAVASFCFAVLLPTTGSSSPTGSSTTGSQALDTLVQSVATLLDNDLSIVRRSRKEEEEVEEGGRVADAELMSTVHTFLPHNGRGSSKSTVSNRNLVQTVLELAIWSRTASAGAHSPGFCAGLAKLQAARCQREDGAADGCSNTTSAAEGCAWVACATEAVHNMQTAVRKLRQELNTAARAQGFWLLDLYSTDPGLVTMRLLRQGKRGDVARMQARASADRNTRILGLLAKRALDPAKATAAESVLHMQRSWKSIAPSAVADAETDENARLDFQLQEAQVRATVDLLAKKVPSSCDALATRRMVIASVDNAAMNDASAVLLAAAMHPAGWGAAVFADEDSQPSKRVRREQEDEGADKGKAATATVDVKLLLRGVETDVSSGAGVMAALESVFSSTLATTLPSGTGQAGGEGADPTSVEVQQLIDRHLTFSAAALEEHGDGGGGGGSSSSNLVVFSSRDVKLNDRTLAKLQADRSTVHVHVADEVYLRLQREGARVGDVTISLVWSDTNDLDLHVICPSGEEIFYGNRKSKCGGELDVDMNVSHNSTEPVENVYFGDTSVGEEAPHGKYQVIVQNYSYGSSKRGDSVPFKVALRIGGEYQEVEGSVSGEGSLSNTVVKEFAYCGRKKEQPAACDVDGSAFAASNVVALTASVGCTIDSLCQLCRIGADHAQLEKMCKLLQEEDEEEQAGTGADGAMEETAEEEAAAPEEAAEAGEVMEETVEVVTVAPLRQVISGTKFDITSRERLYLQLSRLPKRFHEEVAGVFGGGTLLEITATNVAKRLTESSTPVKELSRHGYPQEVINLVRERMKTFSMAH